MARYVLCMPIGQIGSTGPNGANSQLVPSAYVARYVLFMPIVQFMPIGPIGSTGQLVRYVSKNYCQLGLMVPSAQLALYILLMPIGPIGSTGPISVICTIYANWANWFHGPN